MKKFTTLIFLFFLFSQLASAQCKWKNIDSLTYLGQSGIVDTGINATEVYHTSPKTYGSRNPNGADTLGLYFNVKVGAPIGLMYHHSLVTCVGGRYKFSFYFRSLPSDACLCGITVRIYDGTTLVDSVRYSNIPTTWQQYVSPVFTATTGAMNWQIYTNVSNTTCNQSGNDLCVDDVVLKNCHYDFTDNFFVCSGNQNYNIHDSIPASAGITNITGAWTGPSTLTGGYLGTFNPALDLNGNYIYTFPISPFGRCYSDTADVSVNTVICTGSCPILRLNNDTTVCKNSLVQLKAKLDTGRISTILWSPSWGLSNPNIYNPTTTVTKDTMYHVTVSALSPLTLIANGDFSLGNVSFTSSYIYCSASVPPGFCVQSWGLLSCDDYYTINTCPHNTHFRFSTFGDHTTGSGNMMIVNGATTAGTSVWCQTVPVAPNTNYTFSGWFTNVDSFSSSTNIPIWALEINGTQLGTTFSPSVTAGVWLNHTAVWNSGANTTASICIVDNAVNGGGNDFALDDLSFNMTCTLTDSVRVYANIAPTISLPKDSFLCNTVNVNIIPTTTGKPVPTLAWQNGSTTATFTATTLGTYWCDATNVCGTKRDSMKISLGNSPTSVDLGIHRTICNLDSIYLKPIVVSTTPVNYKWQDSTVVDSFKATNTGFYYVRAYNNCGSVWDTTTLTFKKMPTVDLPAHQTICNQNSFTISPTVTGSANLYYKWQDSTTTATYNATTTALYFLRAYNECGSAWDTTTLTFKIKPTVDLGLRKSLCDSSQYSLIPIVTGSNILHYKWQDSSAVVPFIATSTGLYFVRVYNECGSAWDTTEIIFNNKPNVKLGNDTLICDAKTFTINSIVTGTQPISYAWNTGGTSTSCTVSQNNHCFLIASNLCGSDVDTIQVNFAKSPTVTFASHFIKQCFDNHAVILDPIETGTQPLHYLWSNASTDTALSVGTSGNYIVTITNACKSVTDSIKVNLVPMPYKVYDGAQFTICEDTSITLYAQNSGAHFWWNIGSADSAITINKTGLYTVLMNNQNFCYNTDSVFVKAIDCSHGRLVVPNAFTPNGDGVDDIFYPILIGDNAHLKSFKVYNRWGTMVFATNQINQGWDGKFQGIEQPVGTYVFYVEYYDFTEFKSLKGDVTLLR